MSSRLVLALSTAALCGQALPVAHAQKAPFAAPVQSSTGAANKRSDNLAQEPTNNPAKDEALLAERERVDGLLKLYLSASGGDFLSLRENLLQAQARTASACQRWWKLQRGKASPSEQERLLNLWARVEPQGASRAIQELLQTRWRKLDPEEFVNCDGADALHERLCFRLSQLGPDSAQAFLSLAGDATLPVMARIRSLEQCAALAPSPWLGAITARALEEPSDHRLREAYERALTRRLNKDPEARQALNADLQRQLARPGLSAALTRKYWTILAQSSQSLDPQVYAELCAKLSNPLVKVADRVVFAQLLAARPPARKALLDELTKLYPRAASRRTEAIVLGQALIALPAATRSSFLNRHPTWLNQDPTLAGLSWRDATLPSDSTQRGALLRSGLHSPWPRIQAGALSRMQGPCSRPNARKAARLAGPQSRGGSSDRGVRREAVDALGRCADRYALRQLRHLADSDAVGAYDRGRALRRYVELLPVRPKSARQLREIIGQAPNELGRSALFLGLAQIERPPAYLVEELCRWAQSQQPLIQRTSAKAAKRALARLKRAHQCPSRS